MTVPYSSTFCIMHCFLCKNFVGFFQKKFVTLVLYLIIPEKVLERTLRAWVLHLIIPGLVFIVPRKSIFPFFPLSIYTSEAGALKEIIHIPVKCQEKYLT